MNMEKEYLQIFRPRLDEMTDHLISSRGGVLLSTDAKESIIRSVLGIMHIYVQGYFKDFCTSAIQEENPLAAYDFSLVTQEQKAACARLFVRQYLSGELRLPDRMREVIDAYLQKREAFLRKMLDDLVTYRSEICAALFDGKEYHSITGITFTGDIHNGGKSTTVLVSDVGRLVYKPRSLSVDQEAFSFIGKYFGDILLVPRVFACDHRFGVCQFIEKRVATDEAHARAYYYALGGTAAVIRMLGSSDMHMENLCAVGSRLAFLDLETLLVPITRLGDSSFRIYDESDESAVLNSLLYASFLNLVHRDDNWRKEFSILLNTDEDGSAPVIEGVRRSVLEYEEEFFSGFSDLYDRCLMRREELLTDIARHFSDQVYRCLIWPTKAYSDLVVHLHSRYAYRSEDYYRIQCDKLPKVLPDGKTVRCDAVTSSEAAHILAGEIPYFYTYGSQTGIYADGACLCEHYYEKSAVSRALEILRGMNEEEKQFEIHLMQLSLRGFGRALDEKRARTVSVKDCSPLSAWDALSASEEIMERIWKDKLLLPSGDVTWFSFNPGRENSTLMEHGLYSGIAGMAVYMAAVSCAARSEEMKQKALTCLDSSMRMLDRFLMSDSVLEELNEGAHFSMGEGDGLAGVIRSIVMVNRYRSGAFTAHLEKAKQLLLKLDPTHCDDTDKAGGIAGMIVTLCRYEEFYDDARIQPVIRSLADRLINLKRLEHKGKYLWKTLPDKRCPVCGAVHGMTGIGESLLMADHRLREDTYETDAMDALAYEDASYSEKMNGWPDMRSPGSGVKARGNCYGSQGMGIIFHRLLKLGISREVISRNLERARRSVPQDSLYPLDHLCCGNMSTVDYDLETGRMDEAGKILAAVVSCAKKEEGEYRFGSDSTTPNQNVTLFYGLAGIGYELLRYTDPLRYPTVL